jgi:hypothetical protein
MKSLKQTLIATAIVMLSGINETQAQTPVDGVLNHTNGYLTVHAYDASYDDGSFAKLWYNGKEKTVKFFNSDSNFDTRISASLSHNSDYFIMQPYDKTYDDGSYAKIWYNGKEKTINFKNSEDGTDTRISASLSHNGGYFIIQPYNKSYDDGSNAKIFYDGPNKTVKIFNSSGAYSNLAARVVYAEDIRAKEVRVTTTGFPDYVFGHDYKLKSLNEVETYIKEHKHLPGVPSEKAVLAMDGGMPLGDMTKILFEKVEELTLYIIQQQKEIDTLKLK